MRFGFMPLPKLMLHSVTLLSVLLLCAPLSIRAQSTEPSDCKQGTTLPGIMKVCEKEGKRCNCEIQRFDCLAKKLDRLSQKKREELNMLGVSKEQWDALCNNQRLAFFNIVTVIKFALNQMDPQLNLEDFGLRVDWDPRKGILQDRVFFKGTARFYSEVDELGDEFFSEDIFKGGKHGEYFASLRHNNLHKSLQISFVRTQDRLDSDLDIFNPNLKLKNGIIFGPILHVFEVGGNRFSKLLGWGGKTSPYEVAFSRDWECQ